MAVFHVQHVLEIRIGGDWDLNLVRPMNRTGFEVDIVGQRYVDPLDRLRPTSGKGQPETQGNKTNAAGPKAGFE